MKKIIFLVFCSLICLLNLDARAQEGEKYKIKPSEDKSSPAGIYIPENLNDCFTELKRMLSPELIKEMQAGAEADMAKYHHGLGMWIRNNWGLWSGSRLKTYFNNLEVRHPDDMSSIILDSLWRTLNNKPIKLEEQIKYYQDYWKKVKEQKKN
ncbi:MAG: hypothetical protein PHT53_03445 [Candidatus Omnitrophica bacterium]|nr:hypothetical protein [Candidatus Omnitrophota bacterium]